MTTEETIKAMKWPALIKEAKLYDELCYGENACFGVRDMVYLDMLNAEIFRRREIAHEHRGY
jgi:hypothetical protein